MEGTVHPMVALVLLTAETVRLSGVTGLVGPVEKRKQKRLIFTAYKNRSGSKVN